MEAKYCVHYPSNVFCNMQSLENWEISFQKSFYLSNQREANNTKYRSIFVTSYNKKLGLVYTTD